MNSIKISFKKYFLLFLVGVIAFTSSPQQVLAQATDTEFYSSNDILFYDPNSCVVGKNEGSGALTGNDNLEKILRYYVGKGLSLAQAAGIAGNYQQESGFNPAIRQGVNAGVIVDESYIPQNGVGFGIAQWTFTSRQKPLMDLANQTGRKYIDLSLQLDFSWKEMEAGRLNVSNFKEITGDDAPEKAAYIFHKEFEGSSDSEEKVRAVRGGNAKNIYNQFKTVIPDNSNPDSQPATAVCTGSGNPSSFTSDGFVIYNQNDPQWADKSYGRGSTIGKTGCGPSAMAMIITAFSGKNVTPAETAAYGEANGTVYYPEELGGNTPAGSSWNLHEVIGDKWGIKYKTLTPSVAEINTALRGGALIITSGTGPAPYTSGGHYIVIRGVTADGKWKIGDSNGTEGIENSKKEWDPGFIMQNTALDNIRAMTK